jgi:hypothetical protein
MRISASHSSIFCSKKKDMEECIIPTELCVLVGQVLVTNLIDTVSRATTDNTVLRIEFRALAHYVVQTNQYLRQRILGSLSEADRLMIDPIKIKLASSMRHCMETSPMHFSGSQWYTAVILATIPFKCNNGIHELVIDRNRRHGFTTLLQAFLVSIQEKKDTNNYVIITANGRQVGQYYKEMKVKFPIFSINSKKHLSSLESMGDKAYLNGLVFLLDIDVTYQEGSDGEIIQNEFFIKPYARFKETLQRIYSMYRSSILVIRPHHVKQWMGTHWF